MLMYDTLLVNQKSVSVLSEIQTDCGTIHMELSCKCELMIDQLPVYAPAIHAAHV